MKNFVTCSQQDYDFYTIPFPLRALKKDCRNKYIYSELGKLHPCFSDDCCFDAKFHLEKTGLKADVVVMQKFRLAEYKAKFKQLYIEERKRIPFFKAHKSDKTIIVVMSLLLIFLMYFLWARIQRKKTVNTINDVVPEELSIEEKKTSVSNNCVLLQKIAEYEGTILQFEWKTDGFTEHSSVTVKGIFPEQLLNEIDNASFSSVVFENNLPLMTVNLTEKVINSDFSQAQNELKRADFRSFVLQTGALISQETVSPFSMNIIIPWNLTQPQNSVLCSIIDFLISNEMSVADFSVNQNEDSMNISIEFLSVKNNAFAVIGNELRSQIGVFQNQKQNQLPENKTPAVKKQLQQSQTQQNDLKKIGQVTKPDGTLITFYKNKDGKIVSSQGR